MMYSYTTKILSFFKSLRATPGVRLTEQQIGLKIGRWFNSAPPNIDADDTDGEEISTFEDWEDT